MCIRDRCTHTPTITDRQTDTVKDREITDECAMHASHTPTITDRQTDTVKDREITDECAMHASHTHTITDRQTDTVKDREITDECAMHASECSVLTLYSQYVWWTGAGPLRITISRRGTEHRVVV